MAKIKFYTDEHIAKAVAKGLRARGIDAISCVEADMRSASDETQLAYATQDGRVMVTFDNDFLKIHANGFAHAGIAFASNPLSIGEMVSILLLMNGVLDAADMKNQIEFI